MALRLRQVRWAVTHPGVMISWGLSRHRDQTARYVGVAAIVAFTLQLFWHPLWPVALMVCGVCVSVSAFNLGYIAGKTGLGECSQLGDPGPDD